MCIITHSRQIIEGSIRSISPKLIDQSSCRILTTHLKNRPIFHDDWSIRLGENELYRSSQTFGSYAVLLELVIRDDEMVVTKLVTMIV